MFGFYGSVSIHPRSFKPMSDRALSESVSWELDNERVRKLGERSVAVAVAAAVAAALTQDNNIYQLICVPKILAMAEHIDGTISYM
jgi:hypothetical protein